MTPDPIEINLSQLDPKARVVATKVLVDQAMDRHRQALQELHARGWSWAKIGDLIGTSRQNAYQIATRHGEQTVSWVQCGHGYRLVDCAEPHD